MKAKALFVLMVVYLFLTVGQAMADSVTVSYPSAFSTVIDSGEHIAGVDFCCFWSASRGDSVTQTYVTGQPEVSSLGLSFDVSLNALASGQSVDWNVLLDGTLVGSWSWSDRFTGTGTENLNLSFAPVFGAGSYTISMVVTNEVPLGAGSIGINNGTAILGSAAVPEPGTLLLLGAAGLVGLLGSYRRKLRV